jgi:hypothetical protein
MSGCKFSGKVDAVYNPPRNWVLNKPLSFECDQLSDDDIAMLKKCDVKVTKTGKVTVPAGYVTDLASVPRACWALIAPWDVARSAIIHDNCYEKINTKYKSVQAKASGSGPQDKSDRELYRAIADKLFLCGMQNSEPSVPGWKIWSAYYAVRMFGRWAINGSGPRYLSGSGK